MAATKTLGPGTYRAKATSWALGTAKTGTDQIAIEFEATHPDLHGARITWHGFFTEGTLKRTIESLRHCGWQGDDLTNLAGLDTNEVEIVVEEEEYEGKLRAKVRWINKIGSGLGAMKQMDPAKAKAFAASMRGKIRALDIADGRTPAAPKTAATAKAKPKPADPPDVVDADPFAGDSNDDIPF